MRIHALAIHAGQGGDHPRCLTDVPNVRRGQQQAHVSRLSQFVQLHQARPQLGRFNGFRSLERVGPSAGRCQVAFDTPRFGIDLFQFLGFEQPIHFELAEVVQQRPLFGRKTIGFPLQRLQSLARATRHRLGLRAVGLLGAR